MRTHLTDSEKQRRRDLAAAFVQLTEVLVREQGLSRSFRQTNAKRSRSTLAIKAAQYPHSYLLTPEEAAAVLGLSPKTLANHRTTGIGAPFVRCGSFIRYRYCDVLEHIETKRRTSTSDEGVFAGLQHPGRGHENG